LPMIISSKEAQGRFDMSFFWQHNASWSNETHYLTMAHHKC